MDFIKDFYNHEPDSLAEPYSAKEIMSLLTEADEGFWRKTGEKRSFDLFQKAAARVPAYKDFLKKHDLNPASIRTAADLKKVPVTSKKDYLRKYELSELVWDGKLERPAIFSATSGSTGAPFYFIRSYQLEWESSVMHEFFLQNSSYGHQKPTLALVCFGMGVWIGGTITLRAFQIASERGYPVSILTPGINKIEIFNALRNLAPKFEQIILVGYPPFLKDILDEAESQGINLKKHRIRLLCAAESFTEKFRDYVAKKARIPNLYTDTLNIYGTADIGTMAYETPTSILVRRLALRNKKLWNDLFGSNEKIPTLAQYNPLFVSFEIEDGEVLLTGNSTTPLIRYAIGDHGGVKSFGEMKDLLGRYGINLEEEAKKAGIGNKIYRLPFVFVHERTDLSTTLYGLQIYPQHIKDALFDRAVAPFVTGKFSLITKFDRKENQYLEINLEIKKEQKVTSRTKRMILDKIVSALLVKNSEYRELYRQLKDRATPKLVFWPSEHPLYFKSGIKQKWVLKEAATAKI